MRGSGIAKFTFVSIIGWKVIAFCRARVLEAVGDWVEEVKRHISLCLVFMEILHLCMRSMPIRASTCKLLMKVMGWVTVVCAISIGRE